MITGRFVNKLEKDRLVYYQTEGAENLLSKDNLASVWNLGKEEGEGIFFREFPDDLAFTYSVVSYSFDSSGRLNIDNDTTIVKFNGGDSRLILDLLKSTGYRDKMRAYQEQNRDALSNPLPPVKL